MTALTKGCPDVVAADPGLPLSLRLRNETRPDHARIDAAFGRYDLTGRGPYGAFLTAQARVLPVLEDMLKPGAMIPGWAGRTIALKADLAALGLAMPARAEVSLPSGAAARAGAIYVLEGSRLGGSVLIGRIGQTLPCAFLAAGHRPGAWRALLMRLDQMFVGPEDQTAAIEGARTVFAAYEQAASSA